MHRLQPLWNGTEWQNLQHRNNVNMSHIIAISICCWISERMSTWRWPTNVTAAVATPTAACMSRYSHEYSRDEAVLFCSGLPCENRIEALEMARQSQFRWWTLSRTRPREITNWIGLERALQLIVCRVFLSPDTVRLFTRTHCWFLNGRLSRTESVRGVEEIRININSIVNRHQRSKSNILSLAILVHSTMSQGVLHWIY